MAQRSGREVIGDLRLRGHGDPSGHAPFATQHKMTTVDELEAQAGIGDAPVEGVEHGERRGSRRLGREPGAHQRVEHVAGRRV